MGEQGKVKYYVLVCRICDPEGKRSIPFESAEARGKWAGQHTRFTGHDKWFVKDLEDG